MDPVETAIREGRIPESRRAHYTRLMARKPKKTAKLLARLEPVLEPPEEMEAVRQYVEQSARAAPVAATGPSDYPQEWLQAGGGVGAAAPSIGGNIFAEPGTNPATTIPAFAGPGEVL